MKIRLSELRKIVARLLAEAPCTSRGHPNAYVGVYNCGGSGQSKRGWSCGTCAGNGYAVP